MVNKIKSWIPIISLIVALLALRWTVVEPYVVPTGSMEPTLKPGDRLYALKCAYDIRFPFTDWIMFKTGTMKRGDVVLFRAPHEPSITYVKRVVGIAGDKIEFRNGTLYVNEKAQPKELAPDPSIMADLNNAAGRTLFIENLTGVRHYVPLNTVWGQFRSKDPIIVPTNHFFAVGDNRDNSSDSRAWGFVPTSHLKGQAMFIWYSSAHDNDFPWWQNLKLALTSPRPERVGTLIR